MENQALWEVKMNYDMIFSIHWSYAAQTEMEIIG